MNIPLIIIGVVWAGYMLYLIFSKGEIPSRMAAKRERQRKYYKSLPKGYPYVAFIYEHGKDGEDDGAVAIRKSLTDFEMSDGKTAREKGIPTHPLARPFQRHKGDAERGILDTQANTRDE